MVESQEMRVVALFGVVFACVSGMPALAGAYTMTEMTSAGKANLGVNTSMSFTQARNELQEGGEATNSTFFLLATPKFGYFVMDRVELTLQTGVLMRRLQRTADTRNTETSALVNVGVNYNIPLNERLSLVPGVGIGGYFGGSNRPVTVLGEDGMPRVISESTRARGLDLASQLAIGYRAGEKVQIQAGLTLHYLYGAEFSENVDSLRVSTLHSSLGLGVLYFF